MEFPYQQQINEIKFRSFYLFLGIIFAIIIGYKERLNLIYALIIPLKKIEKKINIEYQGKIYNFFSYKLKEDEFLKKDYNFQNQEIESLFNNFEIIYKSLENIEEFVYLNITEAFTLQLQIAFLIGFFISIPLFWIQIYFFLAKALYLKEQRIIRKIGILSWCLLCFSAYFTQELLLPQAWSFFLSFGEIKSSLNFINLTDSFEIGKESFIDSNIKKNNLQEIKSLSYLPSFAPQVFIFIEILFAMIITSQLPIFFFILINWGYLRRDFLIKRRSWVIILILTWSALISPPDLFSQIFIFIPIFIIYELSIFIFFCKKNYYKIQN